MSSLILEANQTPASPAPQQFPGAYRPGMIPDAAAAQYGAPMIRPGGTVIIWGPGHYDPAPGIGLNRGGLIERGRADGS
jgi:hypothetical protein